MNGGMINSWGTINGSSGGAAGGAVTASYEGNYAGQAPTFTPTTSPAFAFDTSNDHMWQYYNGAWHP